MSQETNPPSEAKPQTKSAREGAKDAKAKLFLLRGLRAFASHLFRGQTSPSKLNDLADPEPLPRGHEFASVIESGVPIVGQHTRLDSRQSENALFSTTAFAADR